MTLSVRIGHCPLGFKALIRLGAKVNGLWMSRRPWIGLRLGMVSSGRLRVGAGAVGGRVVSFSMILGIRFPCLNVVRIPGRVSLEMVMALETGSNPVVPIEYVAIRLMGLSIMIIAGVETSWTSFVCLVVLCISYLTPVVNGIDESLARNLKTDLGAPLVRMVMASRRGLSWQTNVLVLSLSIVTDVS